MRAIALFIASSATIFIASPSRAQDAAAG
ncbi:MAG: cytochrome c family protein, partial [Mesorhizobium sp.]